MKREDDNFTLKFVLGIIGFGVIISILQMGGFIGLIVIVLVGALIFFAYIKNEENNKSGQLKENGSHYPTEKECSDLKKKYPNGVTKYRGLHPGCSWGNVWENRDIIKILEECKDYETLRKKFPHGVENFENIYPKCSYMNMLEKLNEIRYLEEKFKTDEEKRTEEERKKIERQKKLKQEQQRNDYKDLEINYPHGIAEYKKLHPNHSWLDIWEHRTDVWGLEHDYKLKKHDELKERFPHGFESFMKEKPQATIQEIVRNEDYLKTLEERYIKKLEEEQAKDESTKKDNQPLKTLDHLNLLLEWSNKNRENAKKFQTLGFHRWEFLNSRLLYSWLFYYYPTTVKFNLSLSDEENRKTVWNFKNDPDRNISQYRHKRAVQEVLPNLRANLIIMYGREQLKELTFVCVPASTQVKNKARYDNFSKMLCEATGMENGYEHVHFVKDGISKNSTNNGTGKSIRPEVTFDDWFEDRLVVLFDDVVTTGETMLYYKNRLLKAGAIVVGGLCLGKTKHEKPINPLSLPPLEDLDHDDELLPDDGE